MNGGCLKRAATAALPGLFVLAAIPLVSGAIGVVRVGGGSMAPTLWPGDVCLVRPVSAAAVGDVVLFTPPGHTSRVLHRVYARHRGELVTRGDANPIVDRESIPETAVAGRVAAVVPVGRLVREWQRFSGR